MNARSRNKALREVLRVASLAAAFQQLDHRQKQRVLDAFDAIDTADAAALLNALDEAELDPLRATNAMKQAVAAIQHARR